MPRPDLGNDIALLRRMLDGCLAQGVFGWGIERYRMRYLVVVGAVEVFYDWADGKVKAALTENGRRWVLQDIAAHRTQLSGAESGRPHTLRPAVVEPGDGDRPPRPRP